MMLFYTEKAYGCNVLPPLAWDIDDMGRTVLPSCGRLANGFLEWISVSYFPAIRTKKLIVSNLACTESQFYERRGSCDLCHLNSVSHCGSTSGEECLCDKGFFYNADKQCTICPAGTFKDTITSLNVCMPCKNGYRAKSGSTSEVNCADRNVSETYNPYKNKLGLIYYQTNAHPNWMSKSVHQQDQQRMCNLVNDGNTLDCGGENVCTAPQIKQYYLNNLDHDRISLLQRPGSMGPSPSGFHEKMNPVKKWLAGTVFKSNLRLCQ